MIRSAIVLDSKCEEIVNNNNNITKYSLLFRWSIIVLPSLYSTVYYFAGETL